LVKISEITGMEGEVMSMHDIFGFKQTGVDEHRVAQGYFFASGIRPQCLEKLEVSGNGVPIELFERRMLNA
jgi:pilus assembly protein CpaF